MAYVTMIVEGEQAAEALAAAVAKSQGRVRVLTQGPGVCVLYDTNMARECVRDVKRGMTTGKLYVARFDQPQETYTPQGGEQP
ncbi:MAG: hypothetical protein GXY76_11205 [Chloroflexi bacterium]|nr:hypothetical protein [Chloroflexota bacterium]